VVTDDTRGVDMNGDCPLNIAIQNSVFSCFFLFFLSFSYLFFFSFLFFSFLFFSLLFSNQCFVDGKRWMMDKHLTLHIISFVIGGWEPCNTNFNTRGCKRKRESSESKEESNNESDGQQLERNYS
jgi:hypothetical protein